MQVMLPSHPPAGFQPEDDMDKMFKRLSQIEPPSDFLSHLLAHIKRLPLPFPSLPGPDALADEELDSLVVRNEKREPS